MIADDGIRGVTSNPTIFEKAIAAGEGYDDQLAELARAGTPTDEIYWELVLADIGAAADVLRPVYDVANGGDGFVSVEVSPDRAHDTAATIEQAAGLFGRLGRPNVLIKIPATLEGLPAIEATIAAGINVNVTLIFSLGRHDAVIEAYLKGLEQLVATGGDPSTVASVASFFVSRVDTETDRRLADASPLRGKVAVANAKLAYQLFLERFSGPRWEALAAKGARLQRPLWASTSTKNPAYSDTLYVDELVGPDTVNTLAQGSIDALRDHGDPKADTITAGVVDALAVIKGLADAGVDFDDVTATLEREGVDSFARSYTDGLATLDKRAEELLAPVSAAVPPTRSADVSGRAIEAAQRSEPSGREAHELLEVADVVGGLGVGVEAARVGHDVDGTTAERFGLQARLRLLVDGDAPAGEADDAEHARLQPLDETPDARGTRAVLGRSRPGRHVVSRASRDWSSRRGGRGVRDIGSWSRVTQPGRERRGPEAVAGSGEADAGVGRVQARVQARRSGCACRAPTVSGSVGRDGASTVIHSPSARDRVDLEAGAGHDIGERSRLPAREEPPPGSCRRRARRARRRPA